MGDVGDVVKAGAEAKRRARAHGEGEKVEERGAENKKRVEEIVKLRKSGKPKRIPACSGSSSGRLWICIRRKK